MLKATGHVFINGVLFILLLWVLSDYIRRRLEAEKEVLSWLFIFGINNCFKKDFKKGTLLERLKNRPYGKRR